jgi:hypothetical protein
MMVRMSAKAYIVDLVEPREVHDAHGMFKAGDYLLRTRDSLALDTQVKIRFNFPDGNGTFIRGRIKALPASDGAPYIVRLAAGDDLEWLISRAAPYAEKVARLMATAAEKQATSSPKTRPIPPPGSRGAGKASVEKGPRTKPIQRSSASEAATTAAASGAATTAAASGAAATAAASGAASPITPPPSAVPPPESLAPSKEQLVERIAQMDKWVGNQTNRVERGETLQASPATSKGELVGIQTEDQVKAEAVRAIPVDVEGADPTASIEPAAEQKPTADLQAPMEERIHALSPNQKKKLAISGNRQARAILMKDEDHSLHIWVMKNPGLVEEEVGEFSAMETLSAEALTFLLQSRRWGACPRVVKNLVVNPQTPPEAIPNLLAFLSVDDLKLLVETPGVRHLVARQARRTLMERSQF